MANYRLIYFCAIGTLFFATEANAHRTTNSIPNVPVPRQQRQRQMKKLKLHRCKHVKNMNILFTDPYYDNSWYNDCRKYWLTHGPTTSHAPSLSSPPTQQPSQVPSLSPTISRPPTQQPSQPPSSAPSISHQPTQDPSHKPSLSPTISVQPSQNPSQTPSLAPTLEPTQIPSSMPSDFPTLQPTSPPTTMPSSEPSTEPTQGPSLTPNDSPTSEPSAMPSFMPSSQPSSDPTISPSSSAIPSISPISTPSIIPSVEASNVPTTVPSVFPSEKPFVPISLVRGSLFYDIGNFVITLDFDENSRIRKLSRHNRGGGAEYVDESALYTLVFVTLSDQYLNKIPFFDLLDLEMQHERTTTSSNSAKLTYSFTGHVILNTSSWEGDIDATQIPDKDEMVMMTIEAFANLNQDISSFVMDGASHASLLDLTVQAVIESPEMGGGSQNSSTTEIENYTGTFTITVVASIVAVLSTLSAFGLLYRQSKMGDDEVEIETPQKKMGAGRVEESMAIKNSARKFRSPFMTVSPPDGTKKYFSKLDDDSVYSKKYGKVMNPNQSLVDSSFEESSYADSLQAPSLVSSRMGGVGGQSDVESLAGMSALDHVRLNSVLQIDEGTVAQDDRSLMSVDTGVFRRIWYSNKRSRITKSRNMSGSGGDGGKKNGRNSGNAHGNGSGSCSMLKLSPPSRDTPTKSSPTKSSPTKSLSTKKSPTKSSPTLSSSKKSRSRSQSQSPHSQKSTPSSLFADKKEKAGARADEGQGIDDASLLGDQSIKSEYYHQDEQDEKLFYSMLGEIKDSDGSGSALASYHDDDDCSEDINFAKMYNGDVSCYSENTSDIDSHMSRTSKLSSVTGSLMVGEYDA